MPTHAQLKFLPYRPDQLFDLVADVGRYPEFLPWCVGARVRHRDESLLIADLIIGFKMFRERFTSHVTLDRPHAIHVRYLDGPFRYLNNHWRFEPRDGGTMIDFYVDFEFRSRVLQAAIGVVFNEAVRLMVAAFERRAAKIYGAPLARGTAPLPTPPLPTPGT
ncbi:MAG: type II toxin-antitoxin system RatA family toxin [Elioraea sp.]|nr:type II toxin-antitoxin system RatA family toxin [Elioraea sp.]